MLAEDRLTFLSILFHFRCLLLSVMSIIANLACHPAALAPALGTFPLEPLSAAAPRCVYKRMFTSPSGRFTPAPPQ